MSGKHIRNFDIETLVPLGLESIHAFRYLGQGRDAEPLTQTLTVITHVVVRDGCVRRDAVVPQRHRPVIPLDARLDVLTLGDMLPARRRQIKSSEYT